MQKLQIGDKVRVKSLEEIRKISYKWGEGYRMEDSKSYFSVDRQSKYCGQIFTVIGFMGSYVKLNDIEMEDSDDLFPQEALDFVSRPEKDPKFYVSVDGEGAPRVAHFFFVSARNEAERLSKKLNKTARVLQEVLVVEPKLEWYNDPKNVNKFVWVTDYTEDMHQDPKDTDRLERFYCYDIDTNYPFRTVKGGYYKRARLATEEEVKEFIA